MTDPTPTEIRIRRASRSLEVDFDDGLAASLPAEYLRVESPSAEVQGHAPIDGFGRAPGPGQRVLVAGKADVNITTVEPIGHYAVRVTFTDGHDTGIFTWSYLHRLAQEHAARWDAYLGALAVEGLSRDPAHVPSRPPARRARHGA